MDKYQRYRELLNARTEAAIFHSLLEVLRAGKVATVLELLEQQLDTSILLIHRLAREADPEQRKITDQILGIIRQYRLRHPRKEEAVIGKTEEDEDEKKAQEKIGKILDGTL